MEGKSGKLLVVFLLHFSLIPMEKGGGKDSKKEPRHFFPWTTIDAKTTGKMRFSSTYVGIIEYFDTFA